MNNVAECHVCFCGEREASISSSATLRGKSSSSFYNIVNTITIGLIGLTMDLTSGYDSLLGRLICIAMGFHVCLILKK